MMLDMRELGGAITGNYEKQPRENVHFCAARYLIPGAAGRRSSTKTEESGIFRQLYARAPSGAL